MQHQVTTKTFSKYKAEKCPISMLTAYDYSTAKYLDEAGIDAILVGDSLGMVVLGYDSTHNVTMNEMQIFTKAVARGAKRALIVADMPFLAASKSISQAIENAGLLIQSGAKAVKIEGGDEYTIQLVQRLTNSAIPVMGHLGFTPQFLHVFGGYNIQGKTNEQADFILKQAKKLEQAGAFAIVLEMIPEEAAKYITDNLSIPTIGIGAGRYCSGQVLVVDDILGKFDKFSPKFVKKYTDLHSIIVSAVTNYINDVKTQKFPTNEHVFNLTREESVKLNDKINK